MTERMDSRERGAQGRVERRASLLVSGVIVALVAQGLMVSTAHAGGFEFPSAGTRSLGRGGATYASANDPMALLYNPAALALVPGMQLSLQTHVGFYSSCFDRAGFYGYYDTADEDAVQDRGGTGFWNTVDETALGDPSDYEDTPLPEVCNSGLPQILPPLTFSAKLTDRLGIGVGVIFPNAVGSTVWGEDVEVGGRTYRGTQNGLPAPTRYALIEEQVLVIYPTIGFGVAVTDYLRFGAAFSWGIADIGFQNIVRPARGEDWGQDIYSDLHVNDFFVPRINLSMHATPVRGLDLGLGFLWQSDIEASGDLTLQSGYYNDTVEDTLNVEGVSLDVPQSWILNLGVRYGHQRAGADNQAEVRDSMWTEVFDIELAIIWEMSSRIDRFAIGLPENPAAADGFYPLVAGGTTLPVPKNIGIPHSWQDQLAIRLGGDWNILPGKFALRLGVSYETSALATQTRTVNDGMSDLEIRDRMDGIDFYPRDRIGAHIGATVRFGRFDLSMAYAHIHQFTHDVGESDANFRQTAAAYWLLENQCRQTDGCNPNDPRQVEALGANPTQDVDGTIVNAGTYSSFFDVVSLGLTYHFQ